MNPASLIPTPIRARIRRSVPWIGRIRLRALAYLVGIVLAGIATVSFTGLPAIPIIGAAVAAAAVSVTKTASRLARSACLNCGRDVTDEPITAYGIACPHCGSLTEPTFLQRARSAAVARTTTQDEPEQLA